MNCITVNDIENLIKEGKIKHVFLDVDECVTDSITSVLLQLNRRFNTNFKTSDVTTWDMTNCFPNIKSIEIEEIFDSKEFFNNLKFKDGAYSFVKQHRNIITFLSKGNALNLARKQRWLTTFFPDVEFIGIEGTEPDKSSVNMGYGDAHIDDNQRNLMSTTAEYKILFDNVPNAEWNKDWEYMCRTFSNKDKLIMNSWR